MKPWYQSKTIWLGVLTILAGIIEYLFSLPAGVSLGTIGLGIINIVIRFLTNQSISNR